MHGSVGIIIESDHPFLFQKEKFQGNDQVAATANYKIQGSETHFPFVGFGLLA
jgi:hypothetical protein